MKTHLFCLMSVLALVGCTSAEKHNARLKRNFEVKELQKDIDYTKKTLLTKHVDIDMYYPKDVIITRLDSFK